MSPRMDWQSTFGLLGFFAACFAAACTGAVFKPGEWYDRLDRPNWLPPDWAFPVAWSLLYIMIAVAAWLVWRVEGFQLALGIWAVQLVLNALWSVLFFGVRRLGLALAEALALWASILACIVTFAPVSATAAWLMVPYLAWVTFACVLNWSMWRRNPGPHPVITMAEMKAPPRRYQRG
ncbi:TspO/MBR family protein [Falsiroseomonas ponticola]|uniref:TspO/MBR family protein n=1 Tax=Falsiroseomonas ponticola TaxID=2786951 RepID=UPI001CF791AE|nr:TspO/MBR family protein [Roseomonas ponticola]